MPLKRLPFAWLFTLGCLSLFFSGWPLPAAAETRWQINGVPLCTIFRNQTHVQVQADGQGGFFTAWEDSRAPNSGVYVQHLDANGAAGWVVNGLHISSGIDSQQTPQILVNPAGTACFFWSDRRNGAWDIYARALTTTGATAWGGADGLAVCTAAGNQTEVRLVGDGQAVYAVWTDTRNGTAVLYAQKISATGTALWGLNGLPLTTTTTAQTHPALLADATLGLVVAWEQSNGTDQDLFMNCIGPAGNYPWGAGGVTVCAQGGNQTTPQLAKVSATEFYLAWEDHRSGSGDIYLQRFNDSGQGQLAPAQQAVCSQAADQIEPAIAMLDAAHLALVWSDFRSGLTRNIYYQILAYPQSPVLPANGAPLILEAHGQHSVRLASNNQGRATCVWSASDYASDIRLQSFTADGQADFSANGEPLCTALNVQDQPALCPSDNGGVAVVWEDSRNWTDSDVYIQRFDPPAPRVQAVAPQVLGNTGTARLQVSGRFFASVTEAGLTASGNTRTGTTLQVIDAAHLTLATALAGAPEGAWTLWLKDATGQTSYASQPVTVLWPRAVSATVCDLSDSGLLSGQKNRPVWGGTLDVTGWDRLDFWTVKNLGTAESGTELTQLKLWQQPDGGDFNLLTAVLLDTFTAQGPRIWQNTLPGTLPFFTRTAKLYITADIGAAPHPGSTCQMAVEKNQLRFASGQTLAPEDLVNPSSQVILLSTETLHLTLNSRLPAQVMPGQRRVPGAQLVLANNSPSPILLRSLAFSLYDAAGHALAPNGFLQQAVLENENGSALASSTPVSPANPFMFYLPVPATLSAQSQTSFTLYVDVLDHPTGDLFALGIADAYAVNDGENKTGISQGVLPLLTSPARIFQGGEDVVFSVFPNPAVGSRPLAVSYYLPQAAEVSLALWSVTGEKVMDFCTRQPQAAGLHADLAWDQKNQTGRQVLSGVYLLRLTLVFADGRKQSLLRKVGVAR